MKLEVESADLTDSGIEFEIVGSATQNAVLELRPRSLTVSLVVLADGIPTGILTRHRHGVCEV